MRILALSPSLQIASQSLRDCSDAAGDVSSMYSTPKSSRAFAILILVSVSKKALANCSPSGGRREEGREGWRVSGDYCSLSPLLLSPLTSERRFND